MKNEIIIYQAQESSIRLEVKIEDETVWLNRKQLAQLFNRDVKTIGKHIVNALKEELDDIPVVANFATTARDGKIYNVEYYNLDMVLSIGYRVKSKQGVQFRIWANKVLRDYLLKGYAINQRVDRIENDVDQIKSKLLEIDFHISTNLPPQEVIFYEGQVFDAHVLISEIIKAAKKSIILIDNYVDESVLVLLSKRKNNVQATIFTKSISKQLELDLKKHNQQYPKIEIKQFSKSHDRFLIIDNETVYHIGASLKDLGKTWVAFSKMKIESFGILNKLGI